jgi:hypothetical protein
MDGSLFSPMLVPLKENSSKRWSPDTHLDPSFNMKEKCLNPEAKEMLSL